ncbi:hypothetical protein V1503_23455 [Bacillus sp. SCS-151]|uniref:hypothetical protein n=1 Tax=Nanhaiella sioensis TaxID=3115293 RepID=UPI00397899C0
MTAQLALLNKNGIALATDSSLTIVGNNNKKVFNTGDKLFQLSEYNPVSIMIYGSAHLMGIPWETIIKYYRKDYLRDISFDSLKEYCIDFFKYIREAPLLNNNYSREKHLIQTLGVYLRKFLTGVDKIMEENEKDETVANVIHSELDRLLSMVINKIPFSEGFNEKFVERNLVTLDAILDNLINDTLNIEVQSNTRKKIKELLISCLAREFYEDTSTGVVITGYGEGEIFPSLYEYKIEGIIQGILKLKLESSTTISSEKKAVALKTFAEKEMIETFMLGIDPNLQEEILKSFRTIILEKYPNILTEDLGITLPKDKEHSLVKLSYQLYNVVKQNIQMYQNHHCTAPILKTIEQMPEEEMAIVAETLINLTSLKKKVTMSTETVGGPIDVACISKNDGLIWIKRKHYFNPELNYRYFSQLNFD